MSKATDREIARNLWRYLRKNPVEDHKQMFRQFWLDVKHFSVGFYPRHDKCPQGVWREKKFFDFSIEATNAVWTVQMERIFSALDY